MKWLIILLLLFAVAALVAARYRRQIRMALYMYRMFKKMRQAGKPEEKQIGTKGEGAPGAQLVRCAGCGSWVAENGVLKLGNHSLYCSASCMEKAVRAG